MSLALFRLGRFSYRRPWLFIAAWAFILTIVIGFVVANDGGKIASNVTIDGTPSQQVLDELRTQFPAMSGGQGSLVFVAGDEGRLDEGDSARALQAAATGIYALDTVRQRPDPMAAIDLPNLARETGDAIEQRAGEGRTLVFHIRKAA